MKFLITSLVLTAGLSTSALAQDFPQRPVTIIVPYVAGAVTDVLARHLANGLQKEWGQPVVVENRPGGGSMVGTSHVAQSEPNGHTLLLTTSAYVTGPAVLTDMPFNPLEDLQPIGLAGYIPMVFVAGPSTDAVTLTDFLDSAKTDPKFAATAGLGSTTHFTVEMLMQATDVEMDVVHYGGGGEAVVAVMGGHADIYASTPGSSLDNIRNGALRGLAIAGENRISSLPDVPSTAELGIEGVNASFWLGMFAPAGIPAELAEKINADLNTLLNDPALKEQVATIDLVPTTTTVAEFEAQVVEELGSWAALAKERGIGAN